MQLLNDFHTSDHVEHLSLLEIARNHLEQDRVNREHVGSVQSCCFEKMIELDLPDVEEHCRGGRIIWDLCLDAFAAMLEAALRSEQLHKMLPSPL